MRLRETRCPGPGPGAEEECGLGVKVGWVETRASATPAACENRRKPTLSLLATFPHPRLTLSARPFP